MADEESLDSFEKRLVLLESLVYGNSEKDADYPKEEKLKKACLDSLNEIHTKINTALTGKKKAALLYQKIPDLKNILDHSYTDELMLSDDAIADSIIAESDFLEKQADLLEKLTENEKHMTSEHIQGVMKYADTLNSLSKIHISQQDEVALLTDESRRLIEAYNNVVSLMSKQFIMWDTTLSKLEQQAQK